MNYQTKSDLKIIAHEVFTVILLVVALFALLLAFVQCTLILDSYLK